MDNEEAAQEHDGKKMGRPRREDKPVKYTVYLPEEAADWAKTQPGGLSGVLTACLANQLKKQKGKSQQEAANV